MELMVSLVVLAVLLIIAVPSYRNFIVESRINAGASDLLAALQYARSEAVKRNNRVTVCASSTGTICQDADNWAQGWIVYVDADEGAGGTYEFDSANDPPLLRVHGPMAEGSTITADANVANYVSYVPDGRSQLIDGAAQSGTIGVCHNGSTVKGRNMVLALGRVQVGPRDC